LQFLRLCNCYARIDTVHTCTHAYIHTYIFFSTYVICNREVRIAQLNFEVFYSVLRALKAIGTLSHNHSLNRRRHEQSLVGREAARVSGEEMETQKTSNSARSGLLQLGRLHKELEEASSRA